MTYFYLIWSHIAPAICALWDVVLSFNSEFWSAIIGSIVGAAATGAISYSQQNNAFKRRREIEIQEKNELNKAVAYSILIKMIRIHTGYRKLHEYIKDAEIKRSANIRMEWWNIVRPIANISDNDEFSYSELALIASIGNSELTNGLMQIDRLYNATSDALRVYSEVRRRLADQMPPGIFYGYTGRTLLTDEQYNKLRPAMLEANSLIDSIRDDVFNDTPKAEALLLITCNTLVAHGYLPATTKIELKEGVQPITS